jgi:cell division protein FtsW
MNTDRFTDRLKAYYHHLFSDTSSPDYLLFFLVSSLMIVSVVFSYSLSIYAIDFYGYGEFHFFIRQFLVVSVAIAIMWILSKINPDYYIQNLSFGLFFGFTLLMFLMPLMPESLVRASGGANRWIRLPGFSLSPVEFFKIGFIYFLAWSFERKVSQHKSLDLKEEFKLLLPYFLVFLVVVFLIAFLQKDLGQVVLLASILAIMLVFSNRSFKLFATLGAVGIVGVILLINSATHRIHRFQQWWGGVQDSVLSFFPDAIASKLRVDDFPEPYQVSHSLNAIHNGGFFGQDLANGDIKLGFLSEVHTDFILAGIAEEWGIVALYLIVVTILMICWRILKIANRTQNSIYHLFAVGIAVMIIVAFLINSLGISGVMPVKGLAVPFLSYGGSAIIASSIAIGMILSISKTTKKEDSHENQ